MKATLELIKNKVTYINLSTNDMIGCPDWKKLKNLIKLDFKQNNVTEISFQKFQLTYGLKEKYSKIMLIEINKDLF